MIDRWLVTEGDREIVPLEWTSNGKRPSTKWAERALGYVVAFGRRAETRISIRLLHGMTKNDM